MRDIEGFYAITFIHTAIIPDEPGPKNKGASMSANPDPVASKQGRMEWTLRARPRFRLSRLGSRLFASETPRLHPVSQTGGSRLRIARGKNNAQKQCVSRESNAGPIDGNDGFYH